MKKEVALMDYSLGEELISAISHGVGTLLAMAGCTLCIVKAAVCGDAWAVTSSSIFGFTLILLYLMSTLYHSLSPKKDAKKVLRVLDHCSVFILIAGTYTPFVLVSLRGVHGFVLFGIEWGLCIIGVVFNAINVDKYEKLSAIVNVCMGWAIALDLSELYSVIGKGGLVFLLAGGAAYTVGAVLYAIGDKVKYMHSIWHFFVLAGSILHFFSIFLYVL